MTGMKMRIERSACRWLTSALAACVLTAAAATAQASTITIDSTNCSEPTKCFGLAWTLTINPGSFGGGLFNHEALLSVADDPLIAGLPSVVISAVNFKAANSVTNGMLVSVPASTTVSKWHTSPGGLNSGGCSGSGAGFICSEASVGVSDPANFVASAAGELWQWYFNTSGPLFEDLEGAHVGAKLTPLDRPGRLLSQEYSGPEVPPPAPPVPEPATIVLLGAGLTAAAIRGRAILGRDRRPSTGKATDDVGERG
jgi:hypothetical protein